MKHTEDNVPAPAARPSTPTTTTPTTAPTTATRGSVEDLINMNVDDMSPEQRARFEIKREHEFYSYYEPIRALATREMDWTDLNSDEAVARHRPVQSSDKALTAFCQLAAIRLKVRRAMIFFFDTTHAYVLAEATRTLSLHDDTSFDDEEDALWLGTTKIPRGFSVCEATVCLPSNGGTNAHDEDSPCLIHIINNLAEDTRFCDRPYVTGGPRARFYAGVPITTPKGLKIGAFCVLDDKPHEGLAKKEIDFMNEMGIAVMSHLDMIKAKVEQRRGTDMVAALGAFTASESSSRRETTTDAERPQVRYDTQTSSSLLTIGNLDSSTPAKRPTLARHPSTNRERQSSSASDRITNIRERSPRGQRPSWFAQNRARSDMSVYTDPTVIEDSTPGACSSDEPAVHSAEQSPNQVMQSASALIQKAVDADGVLFLDASVSGFGNLVSSSFLDKTPDNDPDTPNSGTDGHQTSEGEDVAPRVLDADDQPCPILGASYAARTGSVPAPDARREIYAQLTPKFLRSVLRRSKGAKVWNFNEHGDDYLDEQFTESASDGGPARSSSIASNTSRARRDRKRSLKHAPGKLLAAAFPGVRSLMVLGLWDPQRNQWRAGCVIWSCTPMRMFSNEGEMHYLTAFCDVIMAKLARLDVDVSNNIKSDFISSISHELRSPLHGILGTVEILSEQNVDHETSEMISQIDTCGRTLLDIVDHLLEFSRINVLTKHIGSKPRTDLKNQSSRSADMKNSDGEASALDADVSLDVITEEVIESAVYSFCCSKDQRTLNERNVTVSMDIERHPSVSWDCKITLGAWKRVCVNLVNNALKYTSEGSINVTLKILPPHKKMGRPVAQLSVADTGRGMSKDFLRTKLFRAFSQEDDLTEGTGLGMSMVARIVKGWKGKVDVRSSKGQGSVVSVTMPMKSTRRPKSADLDGAKPVFPGNVWSELSVHVMGSPEVDNRNVVATGRHQQLVAFSKTCSGMGMHTSGPTWQSSGRTDFAVVAEYDLLHLIEMLVSPRIHQSTEDKTAMTSLRAKPIVVLCKDYISARNLKGSRIEQLVRGRVEYVAQPCGPTRLASIINRVLEQSPAGEPWSCRPHSPLTPNTPYEAATPRFDTWRESHTWSGASSPNETESTRRLTLRSRRPSSSNDHRPVSIIPTSDKAVASSPEPDGLGVDTPKQNVPEVADSALTAASLANIEPQQPPRTRNQSIISMSDAVAPALDALKPCLLLVDDNAINLRLLITYAKKNGHAMLKASDGKQAVEAYKNACSDLDTSPQKNIPEVILMDISMPVMDGFEASRHIRAYERKMGLKPVVIIALTGLGSSEAQHEAFVSGINLFLTKPVRLKELTKLLGTIKDTFG
jgi:signal transduction histidine kinase/CheY-like chemotaxis protein/GAF domain-containing protein